MRLVVNFGFDNLELPTNYNHILQATILNLINDEEYRKFIHDQGFIYEKRRFKLYTFSRLLGKFRINKTNNTISFEDEVKLIISSYDDSFCYYLMEKLLKFEEVSLGRNKLYVKGIETINFEPDGILKVVTKSPVTTYSTIITESGSKKTFFYHPDDYKFKEILEKNIVKKYKAIHKKEPKGRIEIKHVGTNPKKVVLTYKGFKITAWMTAFDLCGDSELLKIAYETGLGAKNSQGFGLVERIGIK